MWVGLRETFAGRSLRAIPLCPFVLSAISLLKIRFRELLVRAEGASRHLDLRFHAVCGHLQCEIECIHTIFEIKGPADQRLHVDLSRAHQRQRARINMRVTEGGLDRGFLRL